MNWAGTVLLSGTCSHCFAPRRDEVHVATIDHVVVATNLDSVTKLPLPDDVRAVLEAHLVIA
jgi:hypothetical protein